jgi:predicted kinase
MYRVSKAEIARALEVTDSEDDSNHAQGWATYWTVLEMLLDAGVSVIADQTTWRGKCDVIIRPRLLPKASARIVHCVTPRAQERWVRRLEGTFGWSRAEITALRQRMEPRRALFEPPLLLDRPVLEVDTTDGYLPGLDRILQFASAAEG